LDKITKLIFNNLSKQHIQILSDFTHQHCGFLLQFFLSRFGTFIRSEQKFSKLPVQSSHHCVTWVHQKSSFSFLWTSCKSFGTSMQM